MNFRHATLSDPGRRHPENEDSVLALESDGLALFVVADGVGGLASGAVASQTIVKALHDGFGELTPGAGAENLRAQLEGVNSAIFASHGGRAAEMSGSTIVLVLLDREVFLVAHVGDSRAYLLRDGVFRRLTEDHSLVAEQVRAGVISAEEAAVSLQRHVITRGLGVAPTVDIEFAEGEPYLPGDLFMLCSDGLSDVLSDSEIEAYLARDQYESTIARDLVDAANHRGGPDNISVVLVRIGAD